MLVLDYEKARDVVLSVLAGKVTTVTATRAALALTEAATDAVPVFRCKDCVSCYQSESSFTGYRCKCWGVYDTDCECDPNGFCHKGERRDDHEHPCLSGNPNV